MEYFYDAELSDGHEVFRYRFDAGLKLSEACKTVSGIFDYVFTITMCGFPLWVRFEKPLSDLSGEYVKRILRDVYI